MSLMGLRAGCEPRCPGCAHRSLSPTARLQQKSNWLAHQLNPWRNRLQAVQAARDEQRFNYRDRLCLSTQWQAGIWRFGLWRGDELIDIPDCPVHSLRVRSAIRLLRTALPGPEQFPLRFYVQSAAQISLIVKAKHVPSDWLDDNLRQALQQNRVEGLWLHYNPSAGHNLFLKNGWCLRRDLDVLCKQGYRVARITPYDFFPQTQHVETLVLLERTAEAGEPASNLAL